MSKLTKLGVLGGVALLAACTTAEQEASLTEKLSAAAIYEPVVADGETTITEALSDESSAGVTGFMGFSDGTVKPVVVRTNSDQSILYISIDGAPAIEMARDLGDLFYSEYATESEYAELGLGPSPSNYVYFENDDVSGDGYYGLEAPSDALEGIARYQGFAFAGGENSGIWGDLTIGVDFASGGLVGLMSGGYGSSEGEGDILGSISGTVAGSRMAGVIDINSEVATGQLDMLGAFYGTGAETLAGGMAGTVNGEVMSGDFSTSTRFREECCFGDF